MSLLDRLTFHLAPDIYHRRLDGLDRSRFGPEQFERWDAALRLPGAASLEESFLLEIQEYFHLSRKEALSHLESGPQGFADHFASLSPDTTDSSQLERIYDGTDLEIFELLEWHVRGFEKGPVNYALTLRAALEKGLKRYLDYGSGIGSGGILFAKNGFEVTLADVSGPMLAFARWRMEQRGLPFRTVHLLREPLGEERWDVITLLDVLEHIADPMALVKTLRGHIDPARGMLVVRAPFDDPRPQHIPHDLRTASRFAGLGYRYAWDQMGANGLPVVLTPSHRGALANRCVDILNYRLLGVTARIVNLLRAGRMRALGRKNPPAIA